MRPMSKRKQSVDRLGTSLECFPNTLVVKESNYKIYAFDINFQILVKLRAVQSSEGQNGLN